MANNIRVANRLLDKTAVDMSVTFGASIDLSSYNTSSNKYTFPSDGYIYLYNNNTSAIVYLFGTASKSIVDFGGVNGRWVVPVFKGMRMYLSTVPTACEFIPFN